jgi:hypothetical protein
VSVNVIRCQAAWCPLLGVLIFASLVLGRFVYDGFGDGGSCTLCVQLRGRGEGGGDCGCSRLVVRARAGLGRGLMRV